MRKYNDAEKREAFVLFKRLVNGAESIDDLPNDFAEYCLNQGRLPNPCSTTGQMVRGIYIGPEERFKGRPALLMGNEEIVSAQFDTGELWETHSWINFPIEHWRVESAVLNYLRENDKAYTPNMTEWAREELKALARLGLVMPIPGHTMWYRITNAAC